KQHKASFKAITAVSSISEPLQLLHIDLFGPTSILSFDHKYYCLVITDDYSRFCWVFFLEHKDETYPILKDFINLVENQLNKKIQKVYNRKVLRKSDEGYIFGYSATRSSHEWYLTLELCLTDTLGYKTVQATQSAGNASTAIQVQKHFSSCCIPLLHGSIKIPSGGTTISPGNVSVPTGSVPVPTGSPTDSFFDDEPTTHSIPQSSDLDNNEPSLGIFLFFIYDDEFGCG
ncbi:putative ribonuclease H-like domain-containing protein, partial [Tanacetum coccineum]